MIAVVQRVKSASVEIESKKVAGIGEGLLVLAGIEESDGTADIEWLVPKIINLRIFNDAEGQMNLSVRDVSGEILVVSQFTLLASTKKGNRPSYIRAARPEVAIPLYENFILAIENAMEKKIQTGKFGGDMKVALVNDGPVTIIIDTKNKV